LPTTTHVKIACRPSIPSAVNNQILISNGGGGSGSVTAPGHYGDHPRPRVADRGTPSRKDKRVAPDKEGAADKQCLGEGKL